MLTKEDRLMTIKSTAFMGIISVVIVLAACPTRQNPDLPDGWADEAGLRDADVDGLICGMNRQECEGICVPINDNESCGDCETRCDVERDGCSCQRRGGDTEFGCWLLLGGHPTEWEACEAP
jgi:hypothetical protein